MDGRGGGGVSVGMHHACSKWTAASCGKQAWGVRTARGGARRFSSRGSRACCRSPRSVGGFDLFRWGWGESIDPLVLCLLGQPDPPHPKPIHPFSQPTTSVKHTQNKTTHVQVLEGRPLPRGVVHRQRVVPPARAVPWADHVSQSVS